MYARNLICWIIIDFVASGALYSRNDHIRGGNLLSDIADLRASGYMRDRMAACNHASAVPQREFPLSVAREKFMESRPRRQKLAGVERKASPLEKFAQILTLTPRLWFITEPVARVWRTLQRFAVYEDHWRNFRNFHLLSRFVTFSRAWI